jgi:opacity protein-like surface antigen
MKKILLTAAALAIISVPVTSMAADDSVYIKGSVGLGMVMDSDVDNMPEAAGTAKVTYDSGWLATFAVGYDFAGPMRTEVEYLWQKNDVDTLSYNNRYGNFQQGDFKTQAFMFNGYYDIATGSPWMPYFGAGIGWAKLDLDTPALPLGDNDDVFAYQFMGGIAYAINSQLTLDVQYRFMGTADATIQGADYNMNSNDIIFGVAYSF